MEDKPVPVGVVKHRAEQLGQNIAPSVAAFAMSAEFRQGRTLTEQICLLRDVQGLDFASIGILVQQAKSTVHRRYQTSKAAYLRSPDEGLLVRTEKAGANSILTNDQEQRVVNWIREQHLSFQCPTPKMVRQYAAVQAMGPNSRNESLFRNWWHRFKVKHSDVLDTKIVTSIEAGRTRVTIAQVQSYASEILVALRELKTPRQLLNFDETGFHGRIDKSRKRRCVFLKNIPIAPNFKKRVKVPQYLWWQRLT